MRINIMSRNSRTMVDLFWTSNARGGRLLLMDGEGDQNNLGRRGRRLEALFGDGVGGVARREEGAWRPTRPSSGRRSCRAII